MSFRTWHLYGLGICTDTLSFDSMKNIGKAKALCGENLAKFIESSINEFVDDEGIREDDPKREEKILSGIAEETFEHPDQCTYSTIAEIALTGMIYEQEGLCITVCDDFDGSRYAIYESSYPWELREEEKNLTEKSVREIFEKYISVITKETKKVEYCECENGG